MRRRALPLAVLFASAVVFVALAPGAAWAQPKEAIDNALARARTVSECLTAARRYQSLGLSQDAKRAIDRAAGMAVNSSDWHAISTSYQQLGYQQQADEAFKKSQSGPLR